MDELIVGLTGGIASGKTTVAQMFESLGARIVDADRIASELLHDPSIQEQIVQNFGASVRGGEGEIDRKELARIAFSSEEALQTLNQIMHPPILEEVEEYISTFRDDPESLIQGSMDNEEWPPVLVLDIPLLLQYDLDEACDLLVFIDVPESERLRRVQENRGWEPEELQRRENEQTPIDLKREKADCIIRNQGSKKETKKQVKEIMANWNGNHVE